jgi:hypothetical protein
MYKGTFGQTLWATGTTAATALITAAIATAHQHFQLFLAFFDQFIQIGDLRTFVLRATATVVAAPIVAAAATIVSAAAPRAARIA